MSMSIATEKIPAGAAFDRIAETYDSIFTETKIGRAQRDAVWRVLRRTFHAGDRVLELNCGTGEDALFLAKQGVMVRACDASSAMVETASERLLTAGTGALASVHHIATEHIAELRYSVPFDGVFSNFSGLNCVEDLPATAEALAGMVRTGAPLLLCLSTRFCLIEIVYFALCGRWSNATRRCSGTSIASVGGHSFAVQYPTVRQMRRFFAPHFRLKTFLGVGVAIPPSYLKAWATRRPQIFRMLCALERLLAPLPFFRVTGDHILLRFERVDA